MDNQPLFLFIVFKICGDQVQIKTFGKSGEKEEGDREKGRVGWGGVGWGKRVCSIVVWPGRFSFFFCFKSKFKVLFSFFHFGKGWREVSFCFSLIVFPEPNSNVCNNLLS